MNITTTNLSTTLNISETEAQKWADSLNKAMEKYSIDTEKRICMFVAQCAHECAKFRTLVENLNYSANGLAKTWPSRFANRDGTPNALALSLAHNQEAIANNIYANRMGNGTVDSGDGWKFKGRGVIQITGRNLYTKLAAEFNIDCVNEPDLLLDPDNATLAAAWYWNTNNLNRFADADDITGCTKAINGGLNGLDDRTALWESAKAHLFT